MYFLSMDVYKQDEYYGNLNENAGFRNIAKLRNPYTPVSSIITIHGLFLPIQQFRFGIQEILIPGNNQSFLLEEEKR